jgi:hypothetical protein
MTKKKPTVSNSSGVVSTTSGTLTNISHSLWTSTSAKTTYHNSNIGIGNQFVYQGIKPTPSNVVFSWEDKSVDVSLKNGNDIFKLANAFMEWLDKNEIEYNVKTKDKRKKK